GPFGHLLREPFRCPYCAADFSSGWPAGAIGIYDNARDVTSHYKCATCSARIERYASYTLYHREFTQPASFIQDCRHCSAPLTEQETARRWHVCDTCLARLPA